MARWIRRVVWRTRGPDGRVGHGLGSLVSPGRLEKALLRGAIELTPAEFCLLSLVTAAVGTVAGLLFERPALVLSCAAAGGAIPSLWLRRRVARRIASFERQLPDALTMIAGALRAGQSFLQAADTVSREVPAPLGPELSRLVQETRVNVPLEDALRRLSARVGSLDLDLVVAAVSVQREAGGNLAQVIDRVGETIRDRLRLRGEVRTLTAQGRLSGIIVGSLPLVLGALIWWLSPEYLEILVTSGLGQLMLGAAALLAVIGFFVIRKLVSVDM
ncbi:MAG: type II secretion system F family protein [Bacillota bacterium]